MRSLQRYFRYWYVFKHKTPGTDNPATSPSSNPRDAFRNSMRLNHEINEATTDKKLMNLLNQKGDSFNLINLSTFLKNYSELKSRDSEMNSSIAKLLARLLQ